MLRVRVVGRKEEPFNQMIAGQPGMAQQTVTGYNATLLVQSVDENGDVIGTSGTPEGQTRALAAKSLEDLEEYKRGEIYELTPVA